MGFAPDEGIATMTKRPKMCKATRQIDEAIGYLGRTTTEYRCRGRRDQDGAPAAARLLQARAPGLLELRHTRERIWGRELHRQGERISEIVIGVAERIVYAVVKES